MKKQTAVPSKTTSQGSASAVTTSVLDQIRQAATLDDAFAILQPSKGRVSPDTQYELVETHSEPWPQKRGVSVKVYAVAARLQRPFKVADIEAALPDARGVGYWVRKLAALGFLKAQTS